MPPSNTPRRLSRRQPPLKQPPQAQGSNNSDDTNEELTNSPSYIRSQKIKEKKAKEEAGHKTARAQAASTEARASRTQVTRLGEPVRRSGRLQAKSQSSATTKPSQPAEAGEDSASGKRAAPASDEQPAAKRQKATAGPSQEGASSSTSGAQRHQGAAASSSRPVRTFSGNYQPIMAADPSDRPRAGATATGRLQPRPKKERKVKSAGDREEFRRRVGGMENANATAGPSNTNVSDDPFITPQQATAGPSNRAPDNNPSYNNPPPFWHGNHPEGAAPLPDPRNLRYAAPGNRTTTGPYVPAVNPTAQAPEAGLANPLYYPEWLEQGYQGAAAPGLQDYGSNDYNPGYQVPPHPPAPTFPNDAAPNPTHDRHASYIPGRSPPPLDNPDVPAMPDPHGIPPPPGIPQAGMYPAVQNVPGALVPWPHGPPAAENAQWTGDASQPAQQNFQGMNYDAATVNPQALHLHQPIHDPFCDPFHAPPIQQQQQQQQQQPEEEETQEQQPDDEGIDVPYFPQFDPYIWASRTNGDDMNSAFANDPTLRAMVDPDARPRVDDSKTSPAHCPSRTFKLLGVNNANRDGNEASLTIRDPLNPGLPPAPELPTPHVPGGFLSEKYNQNQEDEHPEGTVIDQDEDNRFTRAEKKELGMLWKVTKTIRPTKYAHPELVKRITRKRIDENKIKRCYSGPRTNSSALARPTFLPDDEADFDEPEDDVEPYDPTSVKYIFKPAPVEPDNLFATVPGPSSASNASQVAATTGAQASSSHRYLPSRRPEPAQADARRADRRGRIPPRSVPLPPARPLPPVNMNNRQPTQREVDEHIDRRRQRLYRARADWLTAHPFDILPRVFRGNTMPLDTFHGQRTAHVQFRAERNVAGFPQRIYQSGPLWTCRDYDPSGFSRAHCNQRDIRERAGELQDEEYDMTEEEFLAFVPWREWKF